MRWTVRAAVVFGCLMALLALPTVVSAHEITHIKVDCPGGVIIVSGQGFADESGGAVTVTVAGPKSYQQTFDAQPNDSWTVSLPLGPSGSYTISWPDPNGGSVPFEVICPAASSPPSRQPSTPTPHPTKTPAHHATLPPTDALTPVTTVARTDTALAALLFVAVGAVAATVRWTAQRRVRRR